ncbi:hypothetical protein SLEP1_g58346 [Rubroshorea leprosula]|uniref:ALOG domain-containing protein n=1 Tax=Rubroshorea leprosula TaxID=152421 RepID=A0AAV5MTK2_9ROSI|nr:hypothetical protein SLEP1_g58346 [Rubroshorea leprosula]
MSVNDDMPRDSHKASFSFLNHLARLQLSRYESRKRQDRNTFIQYLKNQSVHGLGCSDIR